MLAGGSQDEGPRGKGGPLGLDHEVDDDHAFFRLRRSQAAKTAIAKVEINAMACLDNSSLSFMQIFIVS